MTKMNNSKKSPATPWSDTLREQTREAINDLSIGPDGRLHFKHKVLGYAFAEINDLLGDLELTCKKTSAKYAFSSCDELIDAGWAID